MDCEFGGLDPELHDITEVAVVVTDYRLAEIASAEWKVRSPRRIASRRAKRPKISGYTAEAWKDALPQVRQVLGELAALLPKGRTAVPAGQNVRMDVQFLERAYRNCGIPYPFDYHVIDLATLFYAWSLVAGEPVSALSLRQAATTQRGCSTGAVEHRAMADTASRSPWRRSGTTRALVWGAALAPRPPKGTDRGATRWRPLLPRGSAGPRADPPGSVPLRCVTGERSGILRRGMGARGVSARPGIVPWAPHRPSRPRDPSRLGASSAVGDDQPKS